MEIGEGVGLQLGDDPGPIDTVNDRQRVPLRHEGGCSVSDAKAERRELLKPHASRGERKGKQHEPRVNALLSLSRPQSDVIATTSAHATSAPRWRSEDATRSVPSPTAPGRLLSLSHALTAVSSAALSAG